MRIPFDRPMENRRGNEPLEHEVWNIRVKDLLTHLRGRELKVAEICRLMKKNKGWLPIYTKNVLAVADIDEKVKYSKYRKTWFVNTKFESFT